ncbi:hypothetical protein INT46_009391, partial [Mucor plumbeus]
WLKKSTFKNSDAVPLIVFGDGMKNKDTVAIKGHTSGATGALQRELQLRSKTFGSMVVDINEFRTSKVSVVTVFKHQKSFYS